MITSNSTITNQFTPNFNIENQSNGQILIYDATKGAYVNSSTLGGLIKINGTQLQPHSVAITHLDTSNSPSSGMVLGVDLAGNLTFLTLSSGGVASLAGLTDTGITTPVDGQFLKYDAGLWINSNITLSNIQGVSLTSPANKDVMFYDGVNWINKQINYTDVDNVPAIPLNGDFTFIALGDTDPVALSDGYLRWNTAANQIIYETTIDASVIVGLSDVAYSGNYSDLLNTPNLVQYALVSSLAPVATSGNYADLTNVPQLITTINSLTDVTISLPSNGQFLKFNGSQWVNTTVGVPVVIGDLQDVNVSGAVSTDILKYDGVYWSKSRVDWAELTGKPSTFTATAHTHVPADITGLDSWLVTKNNSLRLKNLLDTSNTVINNAYLKWKSDGTSVEYVTTIPAASITGLAAVATSGAYADVSGTPVLATVATSGLYADLIGSPNLVTDIVDLNDVLIVSPLDNNVLVYNSVSSKWKNQVLSYSALSGTPTIPTDLNGLSDVDFTVAPTLNQNLKYDGTKWIADTTSFNDLSNAPTNASYTIQGLAQTANVPVANGILRWNAGATQVDYVSTIPYTAVSGLQPVSWLGTYASLTGLPTLFDGTYTSLTGKPSTFTPSVHTHVMADITDLDIPVILSDLADVTVTAPSTNQFLKFNGSQWVNSALFLGSSSINQLSDVDFAVAPVSGNFLRFDGSNWVNANISYSELTGTPLTFAPTAHTHVPADITGLSSWLTSNNGLLTFTGLQQTNNTIVNNGLLKWNSSGTSIEYVTSISSSYITGLATVATSGAYGDLSGTPNLNVYALSSGLATVATSGVYNDLTGKPNLNVYALTSSLAPVATLGTYASLTGTPTIPVNTDFSLIGLSDTNNVVVNNGLLKWNAGGTSIEYVTSISSSYITGLSTVATTGVYSDLTGKPNLNVYALTSSLAPVATLGTYASLTGTPTVPVNNDFTLIGLSDTNNVVVNNGLLKWNAGGTSIEYVTSISSSYITGLAPVATLGTYASLTVKPDFNDYALVSSLSAVATSNDYNDLTNLPAIPTNNDFSFVDLSDTNNSIVNNGYLRWNPAGNELISQASIPATVISGLATVATTNDFLSLNNLPTSNDYSLTGLSDTNNIPVANGILRWNAGATQVDYVSTIPYTIVSGLAPVASLGTYASLTGLPTLFDGTYTSLTGKPSTFTPSVHTHVMADITDLPPLVTTLNDLTDVNAAPTNGQVLKWDSGLASWVAGAPVDFVNISGVRGTPVPNAYLRWNTLATEVVYETSISAVNITGLSEVATSGNISDLTNVDTSTLNNGDLLAYNSVTSKWVSSAPSLLLATLSINELDDVIISTPVDGKVLRFDGVNWVDQVLSFNDLADAPTNNTYSFVDLNDTNNTIVNNGLLKWNVGGTSIEYVTSISSSYISGLSTVATTGSFNDLIDAPIVPAVLNDLDDVNVTGANEGDLLTYNSGLQDWVAAQPATPIMALDDMTDVTYPSAPASSEVLKWNGISWVNSEITRSDIIDIADIKLTDLSDVLNYATNNTDADKYLKLVLKHKKASVKTLVSPPTTAGTLYTINDVLTLTSGAEVVVDTVGGGGEILTFTLINSGEGIVSINDVLTATGGSGTSATFTVSDIYVDAVYEVQYEKISIKEMFDVADTTMTPPSDKFFRWNNAVSEVQWWSLSDIVDEIVTEELLPKVTSSNLYFAPPNNIIPGMKDVDPVVPPAVRGNKYLRWNPSGEKVIFENIYVDAVNVSGLAPVATLGTLDSLVDVDVPTPILNDVLMFDGAQWISNSLVNATRQSVITGPIDETRAESYFEYVNSSVFKHILHLNSFTSNKVIDSAQTGSGSTWASSGSSNISVVAGGVEGSNKLLFSNSKCRLYTTGAIVGYKTDVNWSESIFIKPTSASSTSTIFYSSAKSGTSYVTALRIRLKGGYLEVAKRDTIAGALTVIMSNTINAGVTQTLIANGTDYFVELIYSGGQYKLFLNGTQEFGTVTDSNILSGTPTKDVVRRNISASTNGFKGYVDEYTFKVDSLSISPYVHDYTLPLVLANINENVPTPTDFIYVKAGITGSAANELRDYVFTFDEGSSVLVDNLTVNNVTYIYLDYNSINGDITLGKTLFEPQYDKTYNPGDLALLYVNVGEDGDITTFDDDAIIDSYGNTWEYDEADLSLVKINTSDDRHGFKLKTNTSFIKSDIYVLPDRWTINVVCRRTLVGPSGAGNIMCFTNVSGTAQNVLKLYFGNDNKIKLDIYTSQPATINLSTSGTYSTGEDIAIRLTFTGTEYRLDTAISSTAYPTLTWVSETLQQSSATTYDLSYIDDTTLTVGSTTGASDGLQIFTVELLPYSQAATIGSYENFSTLFSNADVLTYMQTEYTIFDTSLYQMRQISGNAGNFPIFDTVINRVYIGEVTLNNDTIVNYVSYNINATYSSEWTLISNNDLIPFAHNVGFDDLSIEMYMNTKPTDKGKWKEHGPISTSYGTAVKNINHINVSLDTGATSIAALTNISSGYVKLLVKRFW